MLRTRTTRWSVGTAVLCLLLLVAGWLLLVSPRRSQTTDLGEQKQTAQRQNEQLQARIEDLKAQSAKLSTYRADLAGLLTQMPADAAMPQLVREVNAMAVAAGITLDTLTPSGASLLPTASTSGSSGAQASGAQASGARPAGVVQIPIAMVVHGDYFQVVAFLQKLQTQLTRGFLVNSVQVAQDSSGGSGGVQLSLTGTVFAWPEGAKVTSSILSPAPTATVSPGSATTAAPGVTATTPITTAPTSTTPAGAGPSTTSGGQP